MANRTASTLSFSGRVSELETLKARWKLACNLEDPSPQVVVIKAERGLGKTRLALEFYKWLRENEDGWLTKSYWPDSVDIVDRNLDVNPDPGKCRLSDVPIPYLWWGLRAADVGAENGVAADAIATYDRFLAPHLAALFLKSEMVHHGWSLAKAVASVGIDFATSALTIDKFVSVGKGIFRTAEILLGAANKQTLNEAIDRSFSRSDSALDDLRREFKPGTLTCAKVPGVILIDDAQFIHEDPALPSFIERLMYRSVVEQWPLLIIVTHWRAELSPELAESASSFAGLLKHAREGSPTEPGPAACLPGGYLSADHFTEIDLKPLPDLSGTLREKLPGLKPEQVTAILADMGGNPRFLEQVIAFLLEHEGLFESFDTSRSLTPDGLDETLNETRHQEIFTIVLRRLRKAPENVQEAICLASVQGMRFANDFVDQIAQDVLGRPVREPLRKGEEPYSMLVGTRSDVGQTVGQFAERLFHQVAQQHRQSLKSLGGEKALQMALETRVKKVVRESHPEKTDYPEAIGIVCGIALNLFEKADRSEERLIAQRAASVMAYFELQRGSLESSAALYERLLAIKPPEPEICYEIGYEPLEYMISEFRQRIELIESLAVIYRNLEWPAKSSKALRQIIWEVRHYFEFPYDFLFAQDIGSAADAFERWKQDNPTVPVSLHSWSVEKVVSAYLSLSELARAGYHPYAAEGDEPLTHESFLVFTSDISGDPQLLELPTETAHILRGYAYAKDGALGDGEAEKRHVWLLERLGRQAIDRKQYDAGDEYLQRALTIAESLKDDMYRLSVMNNLIVTFGQKGDLERAKKYLELAAPLVNSYINEPTFPVDLVMEKSGPDGRSIVVEHRRVDTQKGEGPSDYAGGGARWIRRAHVPVRYSKEFETRPDEVLSRDRTMMDVIASVFGNAGQRALATNEAAKAKENFLGALSIHEEIGDPAGVFQDLKHLAQIAFIGGEREEGCANLRRCQALSPVLHQVDSRRFKNIEREVNDAMREAGCKDEGADPSYPI